jgi:hypothetical protein
MILESRERRAHIVGTFACWLMMATNLVLAGLILSTYSDELQSGDWKSRAKELATTIPSSKWFGVSARTVWNYP